MSRKQLPKTMSKKKFTHSDGIEYVRQLHDLTLSDHPQHKSDDYYVKRFNTILQDAPICVEQLRNFIGTYGELDTSPESLNVLDRFIENYRTSPISSKSAKIQIGSEEDTWLIARVAYYLAEVLIRNRGMEWSLVLRNKRSAYYGSPVLVSDLIGALNPFEVATNIWNEDAKESGLFKYYQQLDKIGQIKEEYFDSKDK